MVVAFDGLNHCGSRGRGLGPENMFKPSSNLLLTVPKRYLCCGSSMFYVVMSMCI